MATATLVAGCTPPDLCVPVKASLGFFSRGDCVLAESSFFQGHEWLTVFGNDDLDREERFTSTEISVVAEGNRRVDWPKELLVHMNTSVFSYLDALLEYTDRPENQRFHFLLTDKNRAESARLDSIDHIRDTSVSVVKLWNQDRTRALTMIGQACHTIQDSFSPAHTVRDPESEDCIVDVKAYIKRAPGHQDPALSFHGGTSGDTIGHTTTEDSIYREGRGCSDPQGKREVERCLSEQATRARAATRSYLSLIRQALARNVNDGDDELEPEEIIDEAMADYVAEHLKLCEEE